MRYMMVSSEFCSEHLRLIFTILERSPHTEVKCTILIHCADLLERFPNVVEPWTGRIYDRLSDENVEVRKTALYILGNLILRDMIRAQSRISNMARMICDKEDVLKEMSKQFFVTFSHKANNMYSTLPDIFNNLVKDKELGEDNLRNITKWVYFGVSSLFYSIISISFNFGVYLVRFFQIIIIYVWIKRN